MGVGLADEVSRFPHISSSLRGDEGMFDVWEAGDACSAALLLKFVGEPNAEGVLIETYPAIGKGAGQCLEIVGLLAEAVVDVFQAADPVRSKRIFRSAAATRGPVLPKAGLSRFVQLLSISSSRLLSCLAV